MANELSVLQVDVTDMPHEVGLIEKLFVTAFECAYGVRFYPPLPNIIIQPHLQVAAQA